MRWSAGLLVLMSWLGQARAADDRLVVVALGDSITKGVRPGVAAAETFSELLERHLAAQGLAARVVNRGVGGETALAALDRLERDVLALRPAIVAIMYGTNDCYVDPGQTESRVAPADFRRALEEIVARVRAAGGEPIVMTEPCYAPRSPANGLGEHGNLRLARYMQISRQVAARRDVVLIDHFRDWSTARDAGQSLEDWTTDGYHPNPAGHARIAAAMRGPVAEAVAGAAAGVVDFRVRVEELRSHDDGNFLWYHPRAVVFPSAAETPDAAAAGQLITLQKHLRADDHYDGLATMQRGPSGWSAPQAVPALAWQTAADGTTIAVCDVTPGYHAPTGKVLAIGARILYDAAGRQLLAAPGAHQVAYAIYSPDDDSWTAWQTVELPEPATRHHLATPGCAQWLVDESDASLLVPIYHKGPEGQAYSATVLRLAFDGRQLTLVELGTPLELAEVRGLCEPSLARWRGRYYLTLRNDLRGYVAVSDDGLDYAPYVPWRFDDGAELGSYNTQQHWLVHSDGLFLVYTRRGLDNDHIFRHRAPLLLARVDPDAPCVVRASEQVVIPERGGELGNFGANPVSRDESWITVGEGVWSDDARKRGAKGTLFLAHVEWSRPNRLTGGSGPSVDHLDRGGP